MVFPIKSGIFEKIPVKDSTFTILSGGTGPMLKHWTSPEYGIINLLNASENIFTNCKGISTDGRTFIVRKSR